MTRRFWFSQERGERKLELLLSLPFHLLLLWCLPSVLSYFLEWRSQRIILKVSHLQSISFNVASMLSTYLRGVLLYQTVRDNVLIAISMNMLVSKMILQSKKKWRILKWLFFLNNKIFIVQSCEVHYIYIYIYIWKRNFS